MIYHISIDLAHSAYKATIAGDNPQTVIIPTPATLKPQAVMLGAKATKETAVSVDGQQVYLTPRGQQPLTNEAAFSDNWHTKALLYAALFNLLGEGEHTARLVVGVPVAPLMGELSKVRAFARGVTRWVEGEHVFAVNGKEVAVTIVECLVRPQPIGAFYDYALNNNGGFRLEDHNIDLWYAVIDAGSNTLDCTILRKDNRGVFGPDPDMTAGTKLGLSWASQQFATLIKERGQDIEAVTADALLLQYIKHGVKRGAIYTSAGLDVTALAQAALDEWASQAVGFITRLWKDDHQAAVTLLTGGGAALLKPHINYRAVMVLSDPITANARGLAKYAQREGVWK